MERPQVISEKAPSPLWLSTLLSRTDVTDICLNGTTEAYLDSGSGMMAVDSSDIPLWKDEFELREWVLHQLALAGKSWDPWRWRASTRSPTRSSGSSTACSSTAGS